jgi:hypothetical protein
MSCCVATVIAIVVSVFVASVFLVSCFPFVVAALFDMAAPCPRQGLFRFLADPILRPTREPPLHHEFNS